jgi:hypothetical protein
MKPSVQLYAEGLEAYPRGRIVLANVVMALWIGLGSVASGTLWSPAGWIFLGYAVLMVYGVMRKLVCTNCYYYDKWCNIGWGKLAARLFKQGNIEHFASCRGTKIAPFVYGSLTLIPVVLLIIALIHHFTVTGVLILLLIVGIGFYSGTVSRSRACAQCKMRYICPGSAVK